MRKEESSKLISNSKWIFMLFMSSVFINRITETNADISQHVQQKFQTQVRCFVVSKDSANTTGNKRGFDLSPLSQNVFHIVNLDHPLFSSCATQYNASEIQICNPLSTEASPKEKNRASTLTQMENGTFSIGDTNSSSIWVEDRMVFMELSNGDSCPMNITRKRSLRIIFDCDTTVKEDHPPYMLAVDDDCVYSIIWRTPFACETELKAIDQSSSHWSGFETFSFVITLLFLSYIIIGFLVNRFHYNQKGYYQLPHYSFWSNVCGVGAVIGALKCCSSACQTILDKIKGLFGRGDQNISVRYQGLRTEDGEYGNNSERGGLMDDYGSNDDDEDDFMIES